MLDQFIIAHPIERQPEGMTEFSNGVRRYVAWLADGGQVVTWDRSGFWSRYGEESAA